MFDLTMPYQTLLFEQRWFSGRILACHAGGPGSIPGRCIFILCLDKTQRKLNEQICALEDELYYLEEKEKKTPFVVSFNIGYNFF